MPNYPTVPRVCAQCEKPFLAAVSNVSRGNGRFCSSACYGLSIRTAVTKECPRCGDPFTTSDKRRRYCSRACGAAANKGVNHYRWKDHPSFTHTYGYVFAYAPDHPSSSKQGYVREHILVAEKTIGRRLHPDEVVHHRNHLRFDNRPENLQVMTASEHSRLHGALAPDWYTDEELIAALHLMAERLGRNPRKRDVDRFSDLPGRKAYAKHFGRWNEALEAAGLPINMRRAA